MPKHDLRTDIQALIRHHGDNPPQLAQALSGALAATLVDAPAKFRMAVAEAHFDAIRHILKESLQ